MEINDSRIPSFGSAYKVHRVLGAGFVEKVYENVMRIELEKLEISVLQQQKLSVWYEDQIVGAFSPDLWLPGRLIIEIKPFKISSKNTKLSSSTISPPPKSTMAY